MKRSEVVVESLRNLADMIEKEPDCFDTGIHINNHYAEAPTGTAEWISYEPTGLWSAEININKVRYTKGDILTRLESHMQENYGEYGDWCSLPTVGLLADQFGLTEIQICELIEESDCLTFMVKTEVEKIDDLIEMFSPDLVDQNYGHVIRVNYIGE